MLCASFFRTLISCNLSQILKGLALFTVLAGPPAKASAAWLSEVLANPAGVPDEDAEFIEICGDSLNGTSLHGLEILFEGRTHRFGSVFLPPNQAYVLCRDSIASTALGLVCSGGWTGLQLANTRSLWFTLRDSAGSITDLVVPPAREGESQENAAGGNGVATFIPSVTGAVTGFASPGTCGARRNARQPMPASDPVGALDVSALREPALTMPRLSLQNPQGFAIAVPSGFAQGVWRLSQRGGASVLSGKLPERAGFLAFEGRDEAGKGLSPGPYVLSLAKGRKRWHAVMTVIP